MTEEFYQEFDFTDPEDSGKSEIPKTKTFFGEMAFWAFPVNLFAKKGSYKGFTLPGVNDFEGNPKVFNRQRVRKSQHTLFVLAAWVKNADGKVYSKDKQFTSVEEEIVWHNYQYPALNALPNSYAAHLANSGKQGHRLYVSFNETETPVLIDNEEYWKDDPETGQKVETFKKYWGDIQVFENEPALLEAEAEFRAQFDNGEEEEKPDSWLVSQELIEAVHKASKNGWANDMDLLKETALEVADKAPTVQVKKLGLLEGESDEANEELAAEVIARAQGVPF